MQKIIVLLLNGSTMPIFFYITILLLLLLYYKIFHNCHNSTTNILIIVANLIFYMENLTKKISWCGVFSRLHNSKYLSHKIKMWATHRKVRSFRTDQHLGDPDPER